MKTKQKQTRLLCGAVRKISIEIFLGAVKRSREEEEKRKKRAKGAKVESVEPRRSKPAWSATSVSDGPQN